MCSFTPFYLCPQKYNVRSGRMSSTIDLSAQINSDITVRVVLFPKMLQITLPSILVIPMGTTSYHLENERARSHARPAKRVRSFTTMAIKRI